MAKSKMKFISRLLCLGFVLVLGLSIFCACNKDDNFYNDVHRLMKEDFLKQNRTYGVAYDVDAYDSVIDEWVKKTQYDKTSPKTRDIIVDSEDKFSEVFNEFPVTINFEKEMLVIHMFTVINGRPALLNKTVLKNGNLKVYFKIKPARPGYNDTTMPGQKAIAVKIKKTELNSIEFIKQ
ncbi:MAG: hypothetical protein K2J16_00050 [Clostridia bacterium]|nr:hypothetical protein [Clostridia bacterium]